MIDIRDNQAIVKMCGMTLKFRSHALRRFSERVGCKGHGRGFMAAMALNSAKAIFQNAQKDLFFWSTVKVNNQEIEMLFVVRDHSTVMTVMTEEVLGRSTLRRLQLIHLL